MGFWVTMLIMNMLIPAIMIGVGLLFLKRPPKRINYVYGYRTKMSIKNDDTWNFAQKHCGKLWFRGGIFVSLPITLIPMLFVFGKGVDTVGTVAAVIDFLQVILLCVSIIPTERALRRTFDKYGRRR